MPTTLDSYRVLSHKLTDGRIIASVIERVIEYAITACDYKESSADITDRSRRYVWRIRGRVPISSAPPEEDGMLVYCHWFDWWLHPPFPSTAHHWGTYSPLFSFLSPLPTFLPWKKKFIPNYLNSPCSILAHHRCNESYHYRIFMYIPHQLPYLIQQ